MEGLKQCKAFYRHVKSLQTFFHLPKQAERLYAVQQNSQTNSSENEYVNPLEVLTDVKTRWNLIFIAWKRVLKLHNYMRNIFTNLLSKSDQVSQREEEKLERLCLNLDEKIFLQQMIVTLEPFETITHKFSGAKYPILSLYLVGYPLFLMHASIQRSMLSIKLISNDEENSDIASNDKYIPSGRTRQYWQRVGISVSHPVKPNLDNINTVKYLQPVNIEGLLQKIRAAIFLSLDELWLMPFNIMLIATFLNPRFKNFDWCNGNGKDEAKNLVQELYNNAKKYILSRNSINSIISSSDDDDNIFKALKGKERNVKDNNKVMFYLKQKKSD
ncbi:hypothetical protein RhiirC2_791287 [Rhizophagus irregularis]|uniref:Uncharacterized protein n=1 Tax=Rhizophagus irregularis TaxID=588596 RepID=A0A2N1MJH1_9GLOM|nr:hypothetical protein RhiirC2_791287 [Rhizophagus irregularis]